MSSSPPPSPPPSRDEALKGDVRGPPPPPGPPLHGSEEAAARAADRTLPPEERPEEGKGHVAAPAVGGEGGVGGREHEGRVPGKPSALKPSHYDELVHPKSAEESAAVRNRDAKKHGHTKRGE